MVRSNAIAKTFHPTHEIALIRLDETREIVLLMRNNDDAYTLEEWVTNADAPADWKFSELGLRWRGRYAPPGYKNKQAQVRLLDRGSDPK